VTAWPDRLCLHSDDPATREDLTAAAERLGLSVTLLSGDPALFARECAGVGRSAVRAPGGLVAAASRTGARTDLCGPTPAWFVGIDPEVTGRRWDLLAVADALRLLESRPAFVKLPDAKVRSFPARVHQTPRTLRDAVSTLRDASRVRLLVTTGLLAIESEYRVFTRGGSALTVSPYLVEGEPWGPLLRTHRASFHAEALAFVADVLSSLHPDDVPPAAALDVARLADGHLVLLEANQAWAAGLYGCGPDEALAAVLTANDPRSAGPDGRWRWVPDAGT